MTSIHYNEGKSVENFQDIARSAVSIKGVASFCILIVFTSLCFYFFGFKKRIRPITNSLKEALNKIREINGSEMFFNQFKEFDAFVSGNQILKYIWIEFRDSLVFPAATSTQQVVFNTDDAKLFFNETSIVAHRINLRFYNAFPNYLTGAGILGTFLGLVAGIYLASEGLASDDTKKLFQSLNDLLSGASLAFWTSIVGIISSILFSWREKVHVHSLFQLIDSWNRELDGRIKKITPESIAEQQLIQLNLQTEYLEEFTTKVAFNIAEALDNKLNEKIFPALQTLIDCVNEMRRDRGDSNEHLIQQMVAKFTETMSGAAGNEMSALANTISSLNDTLGPLLEQMNDAHRQMHGAAAYIAEQIKGSYETSSKDFSEGVKAAIDQLKSGIAQAGSTLNGELKDAFDRAVERLNETIEKLDTSIGSLSEAGLNTEQMAIKTTNLLQRFDTIAESLNVMQTQMKASLTALAQTARSIENAGNAANENIATSSQALKYFKGTSEEFRSVQQSLQKSWEDYSSRFAEVDVSLENIFKQIDEGLKGYSEATSEYMAKLDKEAKAVTELFGGAVHELTEAIEDFSGQINRNNRR